MYGGDEVSAIVIDLGSHTCKAGYAGEDAPKAVFPSVVGSIDQMEVDETENSGSADPKHDSDKTKGKRKLYVGSQALGYRRDHMEVLSPIKDGVVVDWDAVEGIWDHAFRECLLVDPKEHPMLLAEPSFNSQQQRERTAELMFEKYKVPALFMAKNAVLTSFASGRATSLVVDSGGGSTTVAPVHDGYVLQKVHSGATGSSPFLVINENKKMRLLPMGVLHKEIRDQCDSTSLSETPHIDMWSEFPLKKWVHVGWEVSSDFVRLHIDGEIVGKKAIFSLFNKDSISTGLSKIALLFCGGDDKNLQGYVHNHNVFPLTSSIMEYFAKDPPLQLSIDNSSVSEIEEVSDGIWSIVGGKASCRRIFSLDVVLLDAFSHTVNKELEVIASLAYDDNGAHVEKTSDGEAPLLATHDGIEFASGDRPSKVVQGHASFKLKISQLSSKCDNRLFRIMFQIPKWEKYPFLNAFTPPIRCISRIRNTRVSSLTLGRSPFAPLDVYQASGMDDKILELQHISASEEKLNPSPKRFKLGEDRVSSDFSALGQPENKCNSHSRTTNQVENAFVTNAVGRSNSLEEVDDSHSNSENPESRNLTLKSTSSSRIAMSDATIFKYCLAGLTEKSLLLKEIATSASNEELQDFSHQVSLYSGCSHHRHQIIMAKRLVEEGTKAWKLISQNNHQVQWESVVFEIEEQFMKIACCSSRSLTQQDFELLKRIAGCQEYLAQENFEKMWCWLYPVAYTLSKDWINTMWSSTSPKWIEGFITKEEAESSLQASRGFQKPGTFVLRFPTSRSWPHPDAGSLVVTYLGSKCTIHHKLISLDHIFSSEEKNAKPLQEMLLAEPELSQLGRIIRSH